MDFKRRLLSAVVVIRTYNNPQIIDQVKNFLTMGVGRIIVVINAMQDKGSTRGYLGNFVQDPRVQLIEMFEGYTWSNALNRALMAVQMANIRARAKQEQEFRFILNVSVEAQFSQDDVMAMLNVAAEDPNIGVIGTSFEGLQDNNVISLGRSYRHPRNTGMLIRIEAFGPFWGMFDPWCDEIGGMEDINFILGMLITTKLKVEMLDLKVKLIVGKNYHQPTKEKREYEAMALIFKRWRGFFHEGTPERERIEEVIKSMQLE